MIGRLTGQLIFKKSPDLLIEVHGVGYEVQAPLSTFYRLPEMGQTVSLWTHFHVREEGQTLYGFFEEQERYLFRILIKVSGVGPKLALTILSGMEVNTFVHAVEKRDISALVGLPGVGKKTAERLVIELTGKCTAIVSGTVEILAQPSAQQEATDALVALGYKPQEAARAVALVEKNTELGIVLSSQMVIKQALQRLSRTATA